MIDGKYEYFAFISYCWEDDKMAEDLQKTLEGYKFPTSLRVENPNLPTKIRPVFRDKTDLNGHRLEESLMSALESSRYLIVICSPLATKSDWVDRGIQRFIDLGREKDIIPFIVEGEANSDDPKNECFPPALRSLKGERAIYGININDNGRDAAAVKVVSRMFDVKYDTLWNRFLLEQKKRRRYTIAGLIVAILVVAGVAGYIWMQSQEIKSQYKELQAKNAQIEQQNKDLDEKSDSIKAVNDSIQRAYERLDLSEKNLAKSNADLKESNSRLALEIENVKKANWNILHLNSNLIAANAASDGLVEKNPSLAQMIAYELLPEKLESPEKPYASKVERLLRQAIAQKAVVLENYLDIWTYDKTTNRIFGVNSNNEVGIYDCKTGELLQDLDFIKFDTKIRDVKISRIKHRIAVKTDKQLVVWDLNTKSVICKLDIDSGKSPIEFYPDGNKIVYIDREDQSDSKHLYHPFMIDLTTNTKKSVTVNLLDPSTHINLAIDPLENHLILSAGQFIIKMDAKEFFALSYQKSDDVSKVYNSISFNARGDKYVATRTDSIFIYDISAEAPIFKTDITNSRYATFSKNNDDVLIVAGYESIFYLDYTTGLTKHLIDNPSPNIFHIDLENPKYQVAHTVDDSHLVANFGLQTRVFDVDSDRINESTEILLDTISGISSNQQLILSPDGQQLCMLNDYNLKYSLVDLRTRTIRKNFKLYGTGATPDSSSLAKKRLWGGLSPHANVSYHPSGKWIILNWGDRIEICPTDGNYSNVRHIPTNYTLNGVYVSPDGSKMATTKSYGKDISIYDFNSLSLLKVLKYDRKEGTSICFGQNPNEIFVVTSSYNIDVVDWNTGEKIKSIHSYSFDNISGIKSIGNGSMLQVYDRNGAHLLNPLNSQIELASGILSHNQRYLVANASHSFTIRDINNMEIHRTYPIPKEYGSVFCISFTEDDKYIVCATSNRVIRFSLKECIGKDETLINKHASSVLLAEHISADTLTTLSKDGELCYWNAKNKRKISSEQVSPRINKAIYESENKRIIYASKSHIYEKYFDKIGKHRTLCYSNEDIRDFTMAIGGTTPYYITKNKLLYSVQGKAHSIELPDPRCLCVSSDGATIAVGCHGEICLLDTKTKVIMKRIPIDGYCKYILFANNDSSIIIKTMDRIKKIDIANNSTLLEYYGEKANFSADYVGKEEQITITPDGLKIAFVSDNGILTIWDINTGEILQEIDLQYSEDGMKACFATDNESLYVLMGSQVKYLDFPSYSKLINRAKEHIGSRRIGREDYRKYMEMM